MVLVKYCPNLVYGVSLKLTWLMALVRYCDDGGAWNFSILSKDVTVCGSNLCTAVTDVAIPNTSTIGS